MKAIKLIAILAFTILFSACSTDKEYIEPKYPKLRTCVVKKQKVKVQKNGNKICMELSEYKKLKKQNYRLRVCNELLNKQNIDFNKRFANAGTNSKTNKR